MEIFRIMDEIEMIIKEGKKIPLYSGKTLVDVNRLLDRLDRMRAVLPEELETARILLQDKERIVQDAFARPMSMSNNQKARLPGW